MQKIKLNQKKTVLLQSSPFIGGFLPGVNPVFPSNNFNNSGQPEGAVSGHPRLAVSFEEFEIKSFTDIPALKIVLANLVETVFPLVLWRGEEYDQVGQWTDEQAVARATELLNSLTEEDFEKLYEIRHPAEIAFGRSFATEEERKSIMEKNKPEDFLKLLSCIPTPNRPMLPKQG
jgi:hypothetical protein